eukprot:TRINITY_DN2018_c0_g1_i2.p1 TRINITY_DN2018_c0_g1~~TRINITY_DN2018_c0_g1_i2.p1  ORF type:complete len:116 (+),score=10.00 TRINITY_DN2018_c0_g1_i2:727-1074(+)
MEKYHIGEKVRKHLMGGTSETRERTKSVRLEVKTKALQIPKDLIHLGPFLNSAMNSRRKAEAISLSTCIGRTGRGTTLAERKRPQQTDTLAEQGDGRTGSDAMIAWTDGHPPTLY